MGIIRSLYCQAKLGVRSWSAWTVAASVAAALVAVQGCGASGEEDVAFQLQALTTTLNFQNGVSPTSAYQGSTDAELRQTSPTSNFGAATVCGADGDDGSGVDKSCLLYWDVSSVPSTATVTSASITLRIVDGSSSSYDIYEVLRSWNESQTTWNNASSTLSWQTPGALGHTERGAIVGTITGSTNTTKTVTLNAAGVARIQSWVSTPSANSGLLVAHATNSNGLDFASSETSTAANRPRLSVTYDTGGGGSGGAAGTGGSGSGGSGTAGSGNEVPTDPNLKVAFIGDTSTGTNFTNVLNLIKNEGASAVVVEGDMSYSADPTTWWNNVESVLGTTFPVFIARGNHDDSSWSGYLPKAASHLGGAVREAGAHDANYKTTWRGLVIATVRVGDTGARITPFLSTDPHIWKICNWHHNQQAMQVGGKTNEMGWDVYETCRQQGAIIQTGHEHSYERTRTLTSVSSQIVDSTCSSPSNLCVGPGRTFVNVVGLGGNSVRTQARCLPTTFPYGCNGEWAFIYTSDQGATHGAQFITFNAGAPKVASGYFKNINGQTVDTFTITHD